MDSATPLHQLNSWVEVSEGAYAHNLGVFRALLAEGVELAAVVKAEAYGHGRERIAAWAARHGADSFCVHSLDEALDLRAKGFSQPILVMGHVPLARLAEAVAADLSLALTNEVTLRQLERVVPREGPPARLHLKVETGTHRQGVDADEIPEYASRLRRSNQLHLEAVYTHFANIEDTTDPSYAREQLRRFHEVADSLEAAVSSPLKRHAACTAAVLLFPETQLSMVRLGIGQLGLWPSKETWLAYQLRHGREGEGILRPVLAWKTRVTQVKRVAAGAYVGYGCSYRTTRPTLLAVLPVGYADGYDRRLSDQAHVLVRGRRAPVRGRVCMNLTMVDVTDIEGVELEDEVTLLGRQGDEEVRAEDLARWIGTIHYEVVTRINWQIPRIPVGAAAPDRRSEIG